jgi:hypothetical protein
MQPSDLTPFSALLDEVWALKGQTLTAGQKATFFRSLIAHDLAAVRFGLDAHVQDPKRGQFLPMPADVIFQLQTAITDDGRLGPQEAWALAMRSTDEADTIVWTAEAAEALRICRPILEAGDEVGARMAFLEAYARLVDVARRGRVAPAWSVSLGYDMERRDKAIAEAIEAGRLPAPDEVTGHASDLAQLPAPRGEVLLLGGTEPQEGDPPNRASAVEALLALREKLTTPAEDDAADALTKAHIERLKAETHGDPAAPGRRTVDDLRAGLEARIRRLQP